MSDVLGALFAITLSTAMIVALWRYGLTGLVEILADAFTALARGTEHLVRRLAHGPTPRSTVGIRPNQSAPRRLRAASPRCRHTADPVKVEVRDTLDGRPEVVAWLCPDCAEEVREPAEVALGKVTSAAEYVAWTKAYPQARAALRALGHARWRRFPPPGRGSTSPRVSPPAEGDSGDGYCGFCNAHGHAAIDCDVRFVPPKVYADSTPAEQPRPACVHPATETVPIRAWGEARPVREVAHCLVCADTIEPGGRPDWVHSVAVDQTEQPAPLRFDPPEHDYARH